jgi:hypothetical protein
MFDWKGTTRCISAMIYEKATDLVMAVSTFWPLPTSAYNTMSAEPKDRRAIEFSTK